MYRADRAGACVPKPPRPAVKNLYDSSSINRAAFSSA
jgi:hypothetical protein